MENDKFIKNQPPEMASEGGPLNVYGGARPPAPAWFDEAVSARYENEYVDVAYCSPTAMAPMPIGGISSRPILLKITMWWR